MEAITLLVLADPAAPELAMLGALPDTTSIAVGVTPEAFERTAPRADVILNEADARVLEEVWRMAPRVRWVHSLSAGLDRMLFPALVESPVPLTNARGAFSNALGEFAIGAVLFFAKDFRRLVRSQAAEVWDPFDAVEISGQSLGIFGYGDVGRAVASRAHALGMKVLALRRRPELSRDDPCVAQMFSPDQKHQMLAQSDYVVVTMPLTPESRGFIGEREFEVMKPGAVLINIGRGPVVKEAALIRASSRSAFAERLWMFSMWSRYLPAIHSTGSTTSCFRRTQPTIRPDGRSAACKSFSKTSGASNAASRSSTW